MKIIFILIISIMLFADQNLSQEEKDTLKSFDMSFLEKTSKQAASFSNSILDSQYGTQVKKYMVEQVPVGKEKNKEITLIFSYINIYFIFAFFIVLITIVFFIFKKIYKNINT